MNPLDLYAEPDEPEEEDERDPDLERDRDADDRADRLYEEWCDQQMGWDR